MGKKTKIGKARKDKFYFLAKETGFRSRSAFKLIQLNRRFGFLNTSKVLVDLCAAPGGWLQVAAKEMPVTSEIIGVDLVPIQHIPRVKTFVVDITKEKCKQLILSTLGSQKADVVLHDGSPNVGTAWSIDEFSQANLCLQAFALASEVLRKGGWFITKVFRSRDYEPLKWVISQFFRTLRAVKPEASRMESAEIFLVGQFYLAPDHIDPKFLDVRHVFGEVDTVPDRSAVISTLFKEKKKKKAEGYADGDTLYHELKVSEFINSSDPLHALANANKIIFDMPSILNNPLTTEAIKEDVQDIQVLGKGDIRQILKWRNKLMDELTPKPEPESKMETDGVDKAVDEDEEIETEVQRLLHEEEKRAKKRLKRVRKAKIKLAERLVLKMEHADDHIEQNDEELFNLSSLHNIASLDRAGLLVGDTSQTGVDELTRQEEKKSLDTARLDLAEKRRSAIEGGKRVHFERRDDTAADWEFDDKSMAVLKANQTDRDDLYLSDDNDESSTDADDDFASEASSEGAPSDPDEDVDNRQSLEVLTPGDDSSRTAKSSADEALSRLLIKGKQNPLLVDLDDTEELVKEKEKIKHWLQSNEIHDLLAAEARGDDAEDIDSDDSTDKVATSPARDSGVAHSGKAFPPSPAGQQSKTVKPTVNPTVAAPSGRPKAKDVLTDGTGEDDGKGKKDGHRRRMKRPLSVEEQALALRLIRSAKSRRDLVEEGYHRGRFFEDPSQLPDWFVDDERRHMHRPQLVKKEDLEAVGTRKPVQGRTLKKVEEAKARKRHRLAKRMQRLRAKVEKIPDEISETEKWDQIKNMYKKAGMVKAKRRPLHVIVNTKGGARNPTKKPPKGAKIKIVDRRMKADLRSRQRTGRAKKSAREGGPSRRPVKLLAHKPRNGGRRQQRRGGDKK